MSAASAKSGRESFLRDATEDEDLERSGGVFWEALIEHIEQEFHQQSPPAHILDYGCHRGGLLQRLTSKWPVQSVIGIEPIERVRATARERLEGNVTAATFLSPDEWERVLDGQIDLLTCHEVLYLLSDLGTYFRNVRRVLSDKGMAFVVLGTHAENPLFPTLAADLRALGHTVTAHRPLDILTAAGVAGLKAFVQPLRTAGWINHQPGSRLKAETMSQVLDHHYRHKLLFLFAPELEPQIHHENRTERAI